MDDARKEELRKELDAMTPSEVLQLVLGNKDRNIKTLLDACRAVLREYSKHTGLPEEVLEQVSHAVLEVGGIL